MAAASLVRPELMPNRRKNTKEVCGVKTDAGFSFFFFFFLISPLIETSESPKIPGLKEQQVSPHEVYQMFKLNAG